MLYNKISIAIVTTVLLLTTAPARAQYDDDTTFNFGGEISVINRTSYNDGNSQDLNNFKTSDSAGKLAIRKNEPGINIFVGAKFNQYLGAEVGFGFIQNASASVQNGLQANNKVSTLYADLLGFLNIAEDVDLVGGLGIGVLKSKADVPGATFINKSQLTANKVGVRFDGGVQYYFARSWATRAMLRYQQGNKQFLKSNVSVSIGILYTVDFV